MALYSVISVDAKLDEVKTNRQKRRRWIYFIVVSVALVIYMRENRTGESQTSASSTRAAGEQGVVAGEVGKDVWTCSPTQEALDEVLNWVVRHDNDEARQTAIKTGSIAVSSGQRIKILDATFTERKIRVLSADDGVASDDPRIGRECWVVQEAVKQ